MDITLATPAAARLTGGWRVLSRVETLSNHLYIEMVVGASGLSAAVRGGPRLPKRWSLSRLDEDRLMVAARVATWAERRPEVGHIDEEVEWLRAAMIAICDVAMPRVRPPRRRAAYWWTEEIADLRRASVRARRGFTRARRRGVAAWMDQAWELYREARGLLSRAIGRAKAEAWEELLRSLDGGAHIRS